MQQAGARAGKSKHLSYAAAQPSKERRGWAGQVKGGNQETRRPGLHHRRWALNPRERQAAEKQRAQFAQIILSFLKCFLVLWRDANVAETQTGLEAGLGPWPPSFWPTQGRDRRLGRTRETRNGRLLYWDGVHSFYFRDW